MTPRPSELCQLASTWRGQVGDGGTWWEEKVDGWRALYYRGTLWTRNGHAIPGVGHILHTLAMIERATGVALFIDGEFQVDGALAATKAHCERGGRFREAGTFHAFDLLDLSEWDRGGSDVPLVARKARLVELVARADAMPDDWDWREGTRGQEPTGPAVVVVPDGWAFDGAHVQQEAARVWSAGGEGLMLKDALAPYVRRRDAAWAKVKRADYVPGMGLVARRAAA